MKQQEHLPRPAPETCSSQLVFFKRPIAITAPAGADSYNLPNRPITIQHLAHIVNEQPNAITGTTAYRGREPGIINNTTEYQRSGRFREATEAAREENGAAAAATVGVAAEVAAKGEAPPG